MYEKILLEIVNDILRKNDKAELKALDPTLSMTDDLGFDSLDLALMTVKIEDKLGVDVFENGLITKLSDILDQVKGSEV